MLLNFCLMPEKELSSLWKGMCVGWTRGRVSSHFQQLAIACQIRLPTMQSNKLRTWNKVRIKSQRTGDLTA